eukprot:TRINITY_DN15063_c0_g1_i1.p1 TRINITY_DN15063_c0_g1~~TRINITY_DN15063_c0_g1_i1.p1  ORF type:complete len:327 (+),score=34.81 TRINITY_DN15063_c0_g1_i1:59-982(+)
MTDSFIPPALHYDDDGFIKSFSLDEPASILDHMDKYGFVVVRDVLTSEQCEATMDEFWATGAKQGLDKHDRATWDTYWKTQRFGKMGIIGSWGDVRSLTQLNNRQNPNVYKAFSCVNKTEKLWVDHDRLGIMRPAIDAPEWRTLDNWLHLDCNPTQGYASIGSFEDSKNSIDFNTTLIVQGLLAITSARVEDGGFHCVPGSHKISQSWSVSHQNCGSMANMQVPPTDPLHSYIQQIPLRAGSALIWSSLLFHGNHPNNSDNFRAVQYMRMVPTTGTPYGPAFRNREYLNEDFKPTELGEKLFGFKEW